MPNIKQYTREQLPGQTLQGQAGAGAFGGNVAGMQAQAQAGQQAAGLTQNVANVSGDIIQRMNNRVDVINYARATDQFYNQAFEEFNRSLAEDDILDPNIGKQYYQKLQNNAQELLNSYSGSEDSRAKLSAYITQVQGDFTRKINEQSIGQQRKFIMSKAGEQIDQLSREVASDPTKINEVYQKASGIISEYSPALYSEDELILTDAAHQQIIKGALDYYLESGDYKGAREFINSNETLVGQLPDTVLRPVLSNINQGLQEIDKEERGLRSKLNAYRSIFDEAGLDVPPAEMISLVTGKELTPSMQLQLVADKMGVSEAQLPKNLYAAAYGFKTDSAPIDPNKDYTPDNKLTVSGINKAISKPLSEATQAYETQTKLDGLLDLALRSGTEQNAQAALAALVNWVKVNDPTSVVKEGEVALTRSTQGFIDKLEGYMTAAETGAPVSRAALQEIREASREVTNVVLSLRKNKIETLLQEGEGSGYTRLNMLQGSPDDYNNLFKNVKEVQPQTDVVPPSNRLEEYAKSKGMSVDDVINEISRRTNTPVEQIKQRLVQ